MDMAKWFEQNKYRQRPGRQNDVNKIGQKWKQDITQAWEFNSHLYRFGKGTHTKKEKTLVAFQHGIFELGHPSK